MGLMDGHGTFYYKVKIQIKELFTCYGVQYLWYQDKTNVGQEKHKRVQLKTRKTMGKDEIKKLQKTLSLCSFLYAENHICLDIYKIRDFQ